MRTRKYRCNDSYFKVIDTEDKAYWLGFIYADGCVMTHKNTKSKILTIGLQSEDSIALENFKRDIGFNGIIKEKSHKVNNKEYPSVQMSIVSRTIYNDLARLGVVEHKTEYCKFPTSQQVPDELLNHFIRGFFDGDGSLAKVRRSNNLFDYKISFIGSYSMMDGVRKFFQSNNKLIQDKRCNVPIFTFEMHGTRISERSLDILYKDATIYLPRKYSRYLELKRQNLIYDNELQQNRKCKEHIIKEKYAEGKSYAVISHETGYTIGYINSVLKEIYQAKLQSDKILIKKLYEQGVSKLQIHYKTGRSRDWIRKILKESC